MKEPEEHDSENKELNYDLGYNIKPNQTDRGKQTCQEQKYYYTATHPPLFNVQSQQTAGPPSVSVIGSCKQAMWNIREMIASQTIPIQQDFDLDTSRI